MEHPTPTPMLFPFEPETFWQQMRLLVREEIGRQQAGRQPEHVFNTPGLTYKPLYKIKEVCSYLQVSRPTLYDWIREGRLKPYKIKSRVYFLHQDIQELLKL